MGRFSRSTVRATNRVEASSVVGSFELPRVERQASCWAHARRPPTPTPASASSPSRRRLSPIAVAERQRSPTRSHRAQQPASYVAERSHRTWPTCLVPSRTQIKSSWGGWGSNPRPRDYESPALTTELPPRTRIRAHFRICVSSQTLCRFVRSHKATLRHVWLREQGSNLRPAD